MNIDIYERILVKLYDKTFKLCGNFERIVFLKNPNNFVKSPLNGLFMFPLVCTKFNSISKNESIKCLSLQYKKIKEIFNNEHNLIYYSKYTPIFYYIFTILHENLKKQNFKTLEKYCDLTIINIFDRIQKYNNNFFFFINIRGFELLYDLLLISNEEKCYINFLIHQLNLFLDGNPKALYDFGDDLTNFSEKYSTQYCDIKKLLELIYLPRYK